MDGNGKPDFFGCPEFFMNRVYACESAGGNNMRVYCVTMRGKEVIPLFTVVMPIIDMIEAAAIVKQRAAELWNDGQMAPPIAELELN